MSELKVSQMQEATNVNADDYVMILQNGVNKKAKLSQLGKNNVIQEDGTPNETDVYSSKAVDKLINTASFCRMRTNFDEKEITELTAITGYTDAVNYGDYIADTANSRLEIKNTTLCQLSGMICGLGYNQSRFHIKDSDGNSVVINEGGLVLYQFAGNGYFKAPLQTIIVELDPSKVYYVYLHCNPYETESFKLNAGFGSQGSWISATKIL